MARTENLRGRLLASTNESAPALWIGFYLLVSSHMQRKDDTVGAWGGVNASSAWVGQPGVGEGYCSHG